MITTDDIYIVFPDDSYAHLHCYRNVLKMLRERKAKKDEKAGRQ